MIQIAGTKLKLKAFKKPEYRETNGTFIFMR